MRQTVEQCCCHLGIHCPASVCMQTLRGIKHIGPFTEAQICSDDDAGLLIDFAQEME